MMIYPDELIDSQFLATLKRENIVPAEDIMPLDGSGEIVRFRTVNDAPYEKSGAYYLHVDGFPNWGVMEFGRHTGMVQDTFRFDRMSDREKDILRDANPEEAAAWREEQSRRGEEQSRREEKRRGEEQKRREDDPSLHGLFDVVKRASVVRGGSRLRGYLWERFYLRGLERYVENIIDFAQWSVEGQTCPLSRNALRQGRTDSLLIPLTHVETGRFMGVQWIAGQPEPDGHYRRGFMKGTVLAGACYEIPLTGKRDDNIAYVCEGVCTGLAITALLHADVYGGYRYQRGPVFCCLTTANMAATCQALRARYGSERRIIVMTDHDGKTEATRGYNPGRDAGQDCIERGIADVMFPAEMLDRRDENTDYYDVFVERWAEL